MLRIPDDIPDFKPFRIAGYQKGVVTAVEPWLAPEDTWRKLEDMRVRRGRVELRKGYELHGTLFNRDTFTQASTSGLTNITGTLPSAPIRGQGGDGAPAGAFVMDDGGGQVATMIATEIITDVFAVSGPGVSGGFVNTVTGAYDITFSVGAANDVEVTYDYAPGLDVMGLWDFLPRAGGEFIVACNTRRLFVHNSAGAYFEDVTLSDFFTGDADDYFDFVPFEDILVVNNGADHPARYKPVPAVGEDKVEDIRTYFGFTTFVAAAVADVVNPIQGTLTFPIKEFSVTFRDDSVPQQTVTDDGAGNLIGDIGAGTNTIDYDTGAFDFDFASAPPSAVTVDYEGGPASEIESAEFALRHRQRLIYYNTVETTGEIRSVRGRRTQADLPAVFRDEFDRSDVPTNPEIVGGGVLGDAVILFHKQSESWIQRYTSDPSQLYENISLSRMHGAISMRSIIEMEDTIVAFDLNTIVETNGQRVVPIDEEAPLFMENDLDSENAFRCFGIKKQDTEEQWWTFVRSGQTTADRILVRNYQTGAYAFFRLPFNVLGLTRESSTLAWDDLAGASGTLTADDYPGASADDYASVANEVFLLGGSTNGSVYRIGRAGKDLTEAIVGTARTQKINPFEKKLGVEMLLGHIELTLDRFDGNTAKVRFYLNDDASTFHEETIDLTGVGTSQKVTRIVDVNQLAAYISIEVEFNDTPGLGLDDILLWAKPARESQQKAAA